MSVFKKKNKLAPAYSWRGTAEEPGILVHYRSDHHARSDTLFWCLSWVALLLHLHLFIPEAPNLPQQIYRGLLLGSYALMFLFPAWLLARPTNWFSRPLQLTSQVLLVCLAHLLIHVDHLLWSSQGQHLTALSADQILEFLRARYPLAVPLALVLIQTLLRSLASLVILFAPRLPMPSLRVVVLIFLAATCAERLGHALGHYEHNRALLRMADAMPFYQPLELDEHMQRLRGGF
ncbi:MAG TPA: hypothetical protein VK019_11155 [Pseudomonas sp.]|nr:hypothetical protein [Pseudomonas sp.]